MWDRFGLCPFVDGNALDQCGHGPVWRLVALQDVGYVNCADPEYAHCVTMTDVPQYAEAEWVDVAVSSSLDAVDEWMIERRDGDGDCG